MKENSPGNIQEMIILEDIEKKQMRNSLRKKTKSNSSAQFLKQNLPVKEDNMTRNFFINQ